MVDPEEMGVKGASPASPTEFDAVKESASLPNPRISSVGEAGDALTVAVTA